jgi:hypothetical protein
MTTGSLSFMDHSADPSTVPTDVYASSSLKKNNFLIVFSPLSQPSRSITQFLLIKSWNNSSIYQHIYHPQHALSISNISFLSTLINSSSLSNTHCILFSFFRDIAFPRNSSFISSCRIYTYSSHTPSAATPSPLKKHLPPSKPSEQPPTAYPGPRWGRRGGVWGG